MFAHQRDYCPRSLTKAVNALTYLLFVLLCGCLSTCAATAAPVAPALCCLGRRQVLPSSRVDSVDEQLICTGLCRFSCQKQPGQ